MAVDSLIPFSAETLDKMVVSAVDKFFDTMLSAPVSFEEAVEFSASEGNNPDPAKSPIAPASGPLVVGMVGFIGSLNGVIYLYLSDSFAREVTCNFLGMEPDELETEDHETVNDALGEMANMIAGTFKNVLCDEGFNCRLTIPSILRGSKFSIETTSSVMRRVFRFQTMGQPLVADLLMKPGE
jgi:chemotaxis protein CheX